MESLYKLESLLEDLADEISPELNNIQEFIYKIRDTEKPLSLFSMTSFFPKIESIRIGIFEVLKINEYYSANILYRSILEHFVKAQYIFMKTVENKNDNIGIDYYLFGQDQEKIDYAKSLNDTYRLLGLDSKINVLDKLKELNLIDPEKSASSIQKKQDQFKYKNMVFEIVERLKVQANGNSLFNSLFPLYSELSSCVHGGPDSVHTYDKGPVNAEKVVSSSTFLSLYIRMISFSLFANYEPKLWPAAQISQKYLQIYVSEKWRE